ncbi:bifunctional diguanylate cyclase/phosphodiesterase [Teichococcus rhizosphaerae]|uniref:bifunctional diguanylate cyclase/phosphodiesterase n=1 Tax=Teichococcus rhizosphaerae TaxID=1335062 RepID=UPI00159BA1B6|nr:EAL domain-containing protein [Pseudoroseomonas rhizosphaerae]
MLATQESPAPPEDPAARRLHRLRLAARFLFMLCLLLVAATLAILWNASGRMRADAEERAFQTLEAGARAAEASLRMAGAAPRIAGGALHVGFVPVARNAALVDELRRTLGAEATIYDRGLALVSSATDAAGQRLAGAEMPRGAASHAIYVERRPSRQVEWPGGEETYVLYSPLLDEGGMAVGALRLALGRSEAMREADRLRLLVVLLSGGVLLAVSGLFLLFGCGAGMALARTTHDLRRTAGHLDLALGAMPNGLCIFGRGDEMVLASGHYERLLGLPPGSLRPGMSRQAVLRQMLPGEALRAAQATILDPAPGSGAEGQPAVLEYAWKGRVLLLRHAATPQGGWIFSYEDVTEQRAAARLREQQAGRDALTGLADRAELRQRLEKACAAGGRPSLLMLNLSDFGSYNEAYGPAQGDGLLCQVAARLSASLPPGALLARLGADEFAVLHQEGEGSTARQSAELAQELGAALRDSFTVEGREVHLGTRIGIARAAGGQGAEALLRQAALALGRARSSGEAFAFHEEGMEERAVRRRVLQEDLRRAVAQGEFEMHYQPLVHLRSGGVTGFEALMRWRHPARGLVPPAEFIAAGEESGLIVAMGAWALARSCAEAARWPRLKVAVNLSAAQFRDHEIVRHVRQALSASGLSPELLELEITESVMAMDTKHVRDLLYELRALGVRVVLDDFGTGYSGLSYLLDFPFDKIKIDRSFVRGIGERPECDAVIRAVLGITRDLRMVSLGEGVETATQLARLRECGVQEAQGYLFSPPVPLAQVRGLVARLGLHQAVAEAPRTLSASRQAGA